MLVANVGDFAVKLSCAFFGAYLSLISALKLVAPLCPPPYDSSLLAFLTFKPSLTAALSSSTLDSLTGSPFVYGPALALVLLTALGTYTQMRLLRAAQTGDMESLIRK